MEPNKTDNNRNDKGQFTPNNIANPTGRPPKGDAWADIYNEILDSKDINLEITKIDDKGTKTKKINLTSKTTMRYALGVALLKEGLKGNVAAVKELSDRTAGKPPQSIAIKGDEDVNDAFQRISKGLHYVDTGSPADKPDTSAD